MTEGITVRVGTARDAAAAARLHATTITEGFLPKLGVAFLTRLYARIVRDPRSFLLVVDGADGLAGMIAGTEDVGALYRAFARRDGWRAAIVAAPRLVRHAPSVVETWRYGGGGHGGSRDEADLPPAELVAVSVAPRARGQGVGRALVRALDDEFDQRGVGAVKVTVGADNEEATRLYRNAGYRDAAAVEVHRGVRSLVLVRKAASAL